MASENVIQATFDGFYKIHTKPSWLIDHGMELSISGIDLPDEFECHFSNSRSVAAKRQIGENGVVTIPDEYFLSNAAQIFCWIYLHPTVDSGVTEYEIVIPLLTRPNVDPAEPTQEQQDIVDQAIAALNVAMAETSADAESASASATAAQAAVDSVLNMTVSADTLPSGSDASVTKSVVDDAVHLAFGIPQGAQGVQGEQGVQGPTGATPNFTIGTVQTLLPTQDATATITGTAEAPVLNLGIPKGYSGDATNLAADYSSNKIYAVGEYCIYNGSLYRCITAITTAEAWTAAHWTAAVLGNDIGDLKSDIVYLDGLLTTKKTFPNETITSTDGLAQTSPYMGQEKYGFATKVGISNLAVKFKLALGKSCDITYTIRNASGTVFATLTESYTIESAGTKVTVDLSFDFADILPAGQYYFWMVSSVSSAMGYRYSGSTFPQYQYFELTTDGGWSTGTTGGLTSYRTFLSATVTLTIASEVPVVPAQYVPIANPDVTGRINSIGDAWTLEDDVLSIDYSGSTSYWFNYYVERADMVGLFLKVTADLSITSGALRLYIFGKKSNGTSLVLNCGDVSTSGRYSKIIDLAYESIYRELDTSKTISIGFANDVNPCKASVSNFKIESYVFDGEATNALEFASKIESQVSNNTESISALAATSGILRSPDGSAFFLKVANDGTLAAVKAIPNKTLFIGNSLTNGNGFGMNASEESKAYYSLVSDSILEIDNTATFTKISGTTFEAATTLADAELWMTGTLSSYLDNDLDLVIIQLGDNVLADNIPVFADSCGELIEYVLTNAPNARVAWVGEWYAVAAKQQIIAEACAKHGATFVNIGGLYSDRENRSYIGAIVELSSSTTKSYTVDGIVDDDVNKVLTVTLTISNKQIAVDCPYTSYTYSAPTLSITGKYIITVDNGVASHPGDTGMAKVASAIIGALGLN